MGVYFPHASLTTCMECVANDDNYRCCATGDPFDYELAAISRMPNCPAVPVPQHGRLGDLDRLEQMFLDIDHAPYSGFDGQEAFYSAEDAAQIIRLAPTIIEAEEAQG